VPGRLVTDPFLEALMADTAFDLPGLHPPAPVVRSHPARLARCLLASSRASGVLHDGATALHACECV
jgi:hypothetical protein